MNMQIILLKCTCGIMLDPYLCTAQAIDATKFIQSFAGKWVIPTFQGNAYEVAIESNHQLKALNRIPFVYKPNFHHFVLILRNISMNNIPSV